MLFLRLRFQKLKDEIIRGWYEVPILYLTLALGALSVPVLVYKLKTEVNDSDFYTRHKSHYIVLRPDDHRLDKYPLKWVTDKDVVDKYRQRQLENNTEQ